MMVLLVAAGAAVGAPLRYLLDRLVQARHGWPMPLGTLAVNVAGSFVLGLLAGGAGLRAVPGSTMALLGTGFCGALTTYSTFGYETVRLLADRAGRYAVLNVLVSVVAGLAAAFGGAALAHGIWG